MKKVQIVFHDAGGGHRNAAVALQAMAKAQKLDWDMELVQFQELTDRLDVLRKVTGIRIQEQYNTLLRNGWTLGSEYLLRVLQQTIRVFHGPLVGLLEKFWKEHPADLLISVIPHFNREIAESWERVYPGRPFVTIITDLADFPPRFWIEPAKNQIVIAGTEKAVEQARAFGKDDSHVFGVSGMVLRPEFYQESAVDAAEVRRELGLREGLPTAMVLFGGFGSKVMYEIVEKIDEARLPVQLILICGKNEKLAARLKAKKWNIGTAVLGFTKEVHKLMRAADFMLGKPGPGSIAEAMQRGLPVIVECNSWTLPQERFNTDWVKEKKVGVVLKSFDDVVGGVKEMLEPVKLAEFKKNVAAQNNRAIFEIMEILSGLLGQVASAKSEGTAQRQFDPQIVEAELALNHIHSTEMPKLAWDALEAGFDGAAIRRLAALEFPTVFQVDELIPRVMEEMQLKKISKAEAAIRLVKQQAQTIVTMNSDPFKYLRDFERLWIQSEYSQELQTYGSLDDEVHVARSMGQSDQEIRHWLMERLRALAIVDRLKDLEHKGT